MLLQQLLPAILAIAATLMVYHLYYRYAQVEHQADFRSVLKAPERKFFDLHKPHFKPPALLEVPQITKSRLTSGPPLYRRCFMMPYSATLEGYRGWQCGSNQCFTDSRMTLKARGKMLSKTSNQALAHIRAQAGEMPERMGLTPRCDEALRIIDRPAPACHPLLDSPCEAAVAHQSSKPEDPRGGTGCTCPPAPTLEPAPQPTDSGDNYIRGRIDGFRIDDIDEPNVTDTATNEEQRRCASVARQSLSEWVRDVVDAGNWSTTLREARKRGFLEAFVHTRSTWTMTPTKEKFDWVFSGDNDAAMRLSGRFMKGGPWKSGNSTKDPTTIFFTAPKAAYTPKKKHLGMVSDEDMIPGGNLYALEAAMISSTEAYTKVPSDGAGRRWKEANTLLARPFRVLAIGGADHTISGRRAYVERLVLLRYFDRVLFEALDIPVPGVTVLPIGFTEEYSKKHGDNRIFDALEAAPAPADRLPTFLAAWGKRWKYLDSQPSRAELADWLKVTPLGNRSDVPWEKWWATLTQYRFQICPAGNGVQAPKVMESILAGAVPIVDGRNAAAFRSLANMGYPLAVVDDWNDITAARLDEWWNDLSPKLELAKWMLLSDVWFAFITQPCPITNIVDFLAGIGLPQPQSQVGRRPI